MSTSTKRGGGLGTFVAIIAILAVGSAAVWFGGPNGHNPNKRDDDDRKRHITLIVMFEPPHRKFNVQINAAVDGVEVANAQIWQSPWNKMLSVHPNAQVILSANQQEFGKISCFIVAQDGEALSTSERDDPGSARCYLNKPEKKP